MAIPVIIVPKKLGGLPVTFAANGFGIPVTGAASGIPIVVVTKGGVPVVNTGDPLT